MKKTMLNFKKLFIITIVAAFTLVMFQVVTAHASSEDITYHGKKVEHWSGKDADPDTFFSLADGTLEKELCVDKNTKAYKRTRGNWVFEGKKNSGNYDFSDSDGHYEIYNMSFDVQRDYTGLGDDNPYEFEINYKTDTLNSDLNGEDFKVKIVYEYFDINEQQWKSDFVEHSWTDKHDQLWEDDETFDIPEKCMNHVTHDTGNDDIYNALKAGACRFYISEFTCDTN